MSNVKIFNLKLAFFRVPKRQQFELDIKLNLINFSNKPFIKCNPKTLIFKLRSLYYKTRALFKYLGNIKLTEKLLQHALSLFTSHSPEQVLNGFSRCCIRIHYKFIKHAPIIKSSPLNENQLRASSLSKENE